MFANNEFIYNYDGFVSGAIDEIRIYSKALSPLLIDKLSALTD